MFRAAFAAPLVFAASFAAAGEPAALVIDVFGDTDPSIEPFDELGAGATIRLTDDAELIVMHYASCTETHLQGGAVEIGVSSLSSNDGATVISADKVDCPHKVEFAEDADASGAVVLRSDGGASAVAPRPIFLAPGARTVEVYLGDALIGVATVKGGVARWPREAPDLAVGGVYSLRLNGAGGEVGASAVVRADAGPALVRLR